MNNPTLERAARAVQDTAYAYGCEVKPLLSAEIVRAVLMAVRTLDQNSINAAIDAGYEASSFHDEFHFPTAFRTAIDEVIKDG